MSTTITYRQAIINGMADALEEDDKVFLIGEDIAVAGGAFKLSEGLLERFGPRRVRDTPISEQAIIGTAIGAAVQGLRPIAEIMFADFAGVCFDGIANELAKYRYMTGGQVSVPATIRLGNGAGAGFAAQHSQSVENWFLNVPGLKIAVPGTPADAYGLLLAAIRDPDPVLVFEHKHLFNHKGEIDDVPAAVELGVADVVRQGDDVTLVGWGIGVHHALDAAETLAAEGIAAEVLDLRTLAPLDRESIVRSVRKTGRLVVIDDDYRSCGMAAEVITSVCETRDLALHAPPSRVTFPDVPIPFAPEMERPLLPDANKVVSVARAQF